MNMSANFPESSKLLKLLFLDLLRVTVGRSPNEVKNGRTVGKYHKEKLFSPILASCEKTFNFQVFADILYHRLPIVDLDLNAYCVFRGSDAVDWILCNVKVSPHVLDGETKEVFSSVSLTRKQAVMLLDCILLSNCSPNENIRSFYPIQGRRQSRSKLVRSLRKRTITFQDSPTALYRFFKDHNHKNGQNQDGTAQKSGWHFHPNIFRNSIAISELLAGNLEDAINSKSKATIRMLFARLRYRVNLVSLAKSFRDAQSDRKLDDHRIMNWDTCENDTGSMESGVTVSESKSTKSDEGEFGLKSILPFVLERANRDNVGGFRYRWKMYSETPAKGQQHRVRCYQLERKPEGMRMNRGSKGGIMNRGSKGGMNRSGIRGSRSHNSHNNNSGSPRRNNREGGLVGLDQSILGLAATNYDSTETMSSQAMSESMSDQTDISSESESSRQSESSSQGFTRTRSTSDLSYSKYTEVLGAKCDSYVPVSPYDFAQTCLNFQTRALWERRFARGVTIEEIEGMENEGKISPSQEHWRTEIDFESDFQDDQDYEDDDEDEDDLDTKDGQIGDQNQFTRDDSFEQYSQQFESAKSSKFLTIDTTETKADVNSTNATTTTSSSSSLPPDSWFSRFFGKYFGRSPKVSKTIERKTSRIWGSSKTSEQDNSTNKQKQKQKNSPQLIRTIYQRFNNKNNSNSSTKKENKNEEMPFKYQPLRYSSARFVYFQSTHFSYFFSPRDTVVLQDAYFDPSTGGYVIYQLSAGHPYILPKNKNQKHFLDDPKLGDSALPTPMKCDTNSLKKFKRNHVYLSLWRVDPVHDRINDKKNQKQEPLSKITQIVQADFSLGSFASPHFVNDMICRDFLSNCFRIKKESKSFTIRGVPYASTMDEDNNEDSDNNEDTENNNNRSSTPSNISTQTPRKKKINLATFELCKVLGRGGYGKVLLVKHRQTGVFHAMKVIKKSSLGKRHQKQRTRVERSILAQIVHPFLVQLNYAFQTEEKLYMVLEFVQGGDFFTLIRRKGLLTEGLARRYVAQLSLGLAHLHSKSIIYRDLKPENVLLDKHGHVKLVDFGLSRSFADTEVEPTDGNTFASGGGGVGVVSTGGGVGVVSGTGGVELDTKNNSDVHANSPTLNSPTRDLRSYSFCGTEQYMAPEMILQKGHGFGIDWWSMGVFLCEVMSGKNPFRTSKKSRSLTLRHIISVTFDIDEVLQTQLGPQRNVRTGKIERPFSDLCIRFCRELLERDQHKRIGCRGNGFQEIKQHPFFASEYNTKANMEKDDCQKNAQENERKRCDQWWDDVFARKVHPGYVPNSDGDDDVSHFEEAFTNATISEDIVSSHTQKYPGYQQHHGTTLFRPTEQDPIDDDFRDFSYVGEQ